MSTVDPALWEKARQARDKLVERLMSNQAVSLIDIGFDPQHPGSNERIALRVHLRRPVNDSELVIPDEVDGIPVRILTGDYRLE